jgi:hypothetical protein
MTLFNFQKWGYRMYDINVRQRKVLAILAAVILCMMLIPPFYQPPVHGYAQHIEYGFLFGSTQGRVEIGLLCMQFLTAFVVGIITFVLCANGRQAP